MSMFVHDMCILCCSLSPKLVFLPAIRGSRFASSRWSLYCSKNIWRGNQTEGDLKNSEIMRNTHPPAKKDVAKKMGLEKLIWLVVWNSHPN